MTTEPTARSNSMGRNAALLSAGTLASRLLGMVRETLIAATFDIASTDAFFIAWRVPNALRAMLAEGGAKYIFNPVLGDELHHGGPDAPEDRARMRDALARLKGAALVVLLLTTLAGVLFARPIFSVMAGDFGGDSHRFELGASLLRILFPYILFMGWFALGNSTLQLLRDFKSGAFAPVMLNVAFVAAPFAIVPLIVALHIPAIYGLAIAAIIGGVLQVLWLRPALRREGMIPAPRFVFDDTVRKAAGLFVPALYGQAVYQINIIIAGRFLSSLPRGSASYFSYAQRLADIPQGLFTVALSGAAAIALQKDASQSNMAGVARTYEQALRMAAFVALPLSILLGVYAEAIVPLIFGYGRFLRLGESGLLEVVASLRWQALSVALLAFVQQTTAVFGALKKRRAVVWIATANLVMYTGVAAAATRTQGHVGVAMAMACSTLLSLVLLILTVKRSVPVDFGAVAPSIARVLAATGVTALAARAAVRYLPVTETTLASRVLGLICGGALVALYLVSAWIFGCREMTDLVDKVRSRLQRPGGPQSRP